MNENWLEAQYSVLGSALIDDAVVPKIMHLTGTADFFGPCLTVYKVMRKLFLNGKPVDPVSVNAALGGEYKDFLVQLMDVTPTVARIDHYIELCREQARVAHARELARQIVEAEDSASIRKLLDQANGLMVDKPSLKITTMQAALQSFMERHSGDVTYLSWPIVDLNDRLYAEPGDFILIGGRPSAGKSAFSIQCAKHWAKSMKVGFFSLETSDAKLFDRQMASMTELTMDDIKRNRISQQAWDHICAMTESITALDLEIIPAAGMTPADIRSVTMMKGYQLIIIDYVQLLQASGGNRTEQVTNISLQLHRMAQDMRVTVVGLCQLKRKEGKSDKSNPDSSDLRESGQLEQDADVVMILQLENDDDPYSPRDLFIAKNKEGTTPKIKLAFDGKHQTFSKALRTGRDVKALTAVRDAQKSGGKSAKELQDIYEAVRAGADVNLKGKTSESDERQRCEAARAAHDGQMTILPPSTSVPFQE